MINTSEVGWQSHLRHFWDTRGRTGRVVFGACVAGLYGALYLALRAGADDGRYWILAVFAAALLVVPAMRRFHDLNKPSTYLLLFFIPGINAIALVYLLLAPGVKGSNRWGI